MRNEILKRISMSWTKETCYPGLQDAWSEDNSSLGQCAVTALVVNDFFGGKIMRCMVGETSHYYNLINGKVVDITAEQFHGIRPDYEFGEERSREYLLSSEDTKRRYYLLLKNTKNNFMQFGTTECKLIDENDNQYFLKISGTLGGNNKIKYIEN